MPISPATFKEACGVMDEHPIIIDTGFPIGAMNDANAQLLKKAMDDGKKVYSMRDEKNSVYQGDCQPIYCDDATELARLLKESKQEVFA